METEGIVTLEAMARAVPVIATDLCCLKDNLEGSGGEAIPAARDFPGQAAELIARWCCEPLQHQAARTAARQRFEALRARSEAELGALLDTLGAASSGENRIGRRIRTGVTT
jgi:glycosyltransferase involved in cell wall biosynthesis